MGTGHEPRQSPVLLFIELADQGEQTPGRGVDITAEFGDLGAEAIALFVERSWRFGPVGKGSIHGVPPVSRVAEYLYSILSLKY